MPEANDPIDDCKNQAKSRNLNKGHASKTLKSSGKYSCPFSNNSWIILTSKCVHVCVQQNHDERIKEVEEKPDIHHLHIRRFWEIVADADEHGREYCNRNLYCNVTQVQSSVHSDWMEKNIVF